MARKRTVTTEVIDSMKMLHDQGVKVAMIANVLGFSKWTVYQVRNANWDVDTYRQRSRAHFDSQRQSVKLDTMNKNGQIQTENVEGGHSIAHTQESLVLEGFDTLLENIGQLVTGINRLFVPLTNIESSLNVINRELTTNTETDTE